MSHTYEKKSPTIEQVPAASIISSAIEFLSVPAPISEEIGHYDASTDTWSDRKYHNAANKKHNEAM